MAKILQTAFVVLSLIIIIVYGLPQKAPDSNINPAKENLKKKNSAPQIKHQLRKVRDVKEEPVDRPSISTLPATIDSKLNDTISQDSDESNKQTKPLERSQISTLPATINFEADSDTKHQSSTENDRETRSAESDESSEENRRGNLRPPSSDVKIQPYRPNNRNSEEGSDSHENDN